MNRYFRITLALAILQLVACGGGGGGSSGKPTLLLFSVTGSVVGSPIPAQTATLKSTNETLTTVVGSEGQFSFPQADVNEQDFVILEARFASSDIVLESIVGLVDFGALAADGEIQGQLGATESRRLTITPLSTALTILMRNKVRLLSSTPLENLTGAELNNLELTLNPNSVAALAVMIIQLLEGSAILPAGTDFADIRDDTVALLSAAGLISGRDPEGFRLKLVELAESLNPETLDSDAVLIGEPYLIVPFDPLLVGIEEISFSAAGQGEFRQDENRFPMTWQRTPTGGLRITFDDAVIQDDGFSRSTLQAMNLHPVAGTGDAAAVLITRQILEEQLDPDSGEVVSSMVAETSILERLLRRSVGRAFNAADFSGKTLTVPSIDTSLQLESLDPGPPIFADLGSFRPQGTVNFALSEFGTPSWSIEGGALVLVYPDGSGYEARSLGRLDGLAELIIVDARLPDSRPPNTPASYSFFEQIVELQPSVAAATFVPADLHLSGIGDEGTRFIERYSDFFIRLLPDGESFQGSYTYFGGSSIETDLSRSSYSISGDTVIEYLRHRDVTTIEECEHGSSQSCQLFDQRVDQIIARQGQRIWALEDRSFAPGQFFDDDPAKFLFRSRHTRFYEIVPIND